MKARDGVYKHLPQVDPKYAHIEDFIDKNKVTGYRIDTKPDGRIILKLSDNEQKIYDFELGNEKDLDAINTLVAYVRTRVI